MAGVGKSFDVEHFSWPDEEAEISLPIVRRHVMHEFFRRQSETDGSLSSDEVVALDSSTTKTKVTLERNSNSRLVASPSRSPRSSMRRPTRALQNNASPIPKQSSNSITDRYSRRTSRGQDRPSSSNVSPCFTDVSCLTDSSSLTDSSLHTDLDVSTTSPWIYDLSSVGLGEFAPSPPFENMPSLRGLPSFDDRSALDSLACGVEKSLDLDSLLLWSQIDSAWAQVNDQVLECAAENVAESQSISEDKMAAKSAYRPTLGDHLLMPKAPATTTDSMLVEWPQPSKDEHCIAITAEHKPQLPDCPLSKNEIHLQQQDDVLCATAPGANRPNLAQHLDTSNSPQDFGASAIGIHHDESSNPLQCCNMTCHTPSEHEQPASTSSSDQSSPLSDKGSVSSSGEPTDDLNDEFLDLEASKLRYWLLEQCKSESFCQYLRQRFSHGEYVSSTSREHSTNSPPKITSLSCSPSSSQATSSSKTSYRGKRRNTERDEEDQDPNKRRHITQDKIETTSAPRLACLYNKYDPIMYMSNPQTHKKFEICGMHDFKNMNKLYEHLKRVHSDQPLQCPRCTRTNFSSSEELQAHQTALEPCPLMPINAVKRIQWITHGKRLALQAEVNRHLRGCTDAEKWRFAYRWLFPETSPDETPCPYFQDPVISIVSCVIDDIDARLRELIRSSGDLSELENRIPDICGQFLAQYGIVTDQVGQGPPSLSSIETGSSSADSAVSVVPTPMNVIGSHQPSLQIGYHEDQVASSSMNSTQAPFRPPTEVVTSSTAQPQNQSVQVTSMSQYQPPSHVVQDSTYHVAPSDPVLNAVSDADWLQEGDFAWAINSATNFTADSIGTKNDMSDDIIANNLFAAGTWMD